jgi:hypothetical protein
MSVADKSGRAVTLAYKPRASGDGSGSDMLIDRLRVDSQNPFYLSVSVREISVWRRWPIGKGDKRKYPDLIAVSVKTTGDPNIGSPV